jgi:hypothetical protein
MFCVARSAKMVLELLKKEVELCKLQQDIREQVRHEPVARCHHREVLQPCCLVEVAC